MSDLPPYFMWFPKSYRWSSALLNIISTAPFGGADISEVYQIRRMLESSDQEDDEARVQRGRAALVARSRCLCPSGAAHP